MQQKAKVTIDMIHKLRPRKIQIEFGELLCVGVLYLIYLISGVVVLNYLGHFGLYLIFNSIGLVLPWFLFSRRARAAIICALWLGLVSAGIGIRNTLDLSSAAAATFPLVRALEIHKLKFGTYPARLEDLKKSSPNLEASVIGEYSDQAVWSPDNGCVTNQSYCLMPSGGFELNYDPSGSELCTLHSDTDLRFRCHRGL